MVRDAAAPTVGVAATVQDDDLQVTWSGTDSGSGLGSCTLEVQEDGGAWQQLSTACAGNLTTGAPGHLYTFRFTATDNTGNSATVETQAGVPLVTKYYYHGGRRVAQRRDGVVYYLHGDHLGSVSLATDAAGGFHSRQLFRPYGDTRYQAGTLPTDFGFAGQREDVSTGLLFMHARYYDPALGRFVSADTVVPGAGNPQAFNRYSYVLNSPLNFRDPSGHRACVDEECNWVENPATGDIMWRGSGTPPSPVSSEELAHFGIDAYHAYEGAAELAHGGEMIHGGFRLARGSAYAGQVIVYGTHEIKSALGLPTHLTHARGATYAGLIPYTNRWAAVGETIRGRGTAATLGLVYGVDICEYGWGSKRDVGLDSSEFASAMTVDTAITLGPPAMGALLGSPFGPPGIAIGTGAGYLGSILWSAFGREGTIELTDEYIMGPIWAWENSHATVYPAYDYYYPGYGPTNGLGVRH